MDRDEVEFYDKFTNQPSDDTRHELIEMIRRIADIRRIKDRGERRWATGHYKIG